MIDKISIKFPERPTETPTRFHINFGGKWKTEFHEGWKGAARTRCVQEKLCDVSQ
jgi:hypothetical protein